MNLFDTLVSSTPTTSPGGAPRVIMVPPDHLLADETNTRELRDVEALAQGIFALGLDNPLTVRPAPDSPAGYYKIIAGHRRLAACKLCIEWGDLHGFATNGIPCISKGEQSETTAHLRLILNNRLHRDPTAYEEMLETAQLAEMDPNTLRAELQQAHPGGIIPAKTRDVIAALLNMSPTKAAKYLAIYRHLPPERMEDYKAGSIGTEAAYALVSDKLKVSRKPKATAPMQAAPKQGPAPVFAPNTQDRPAVQEHQTPPTPPAKPQTPPGGAAQDSGKNQLAVTAHQIAKKYRPLPSPRRIMDEMRALVKQHGPENLRDAMQEQLENMWEAYMEE